MIRDSAVMLVPLALALLNIAPPSLYASDAATGSILSRSKRP
ncbi:hypothetical protein ACMAZE_01815 [Pseudopelagicola sp. nBUS_20]